MASPGLYFDLLPTNTTVKAERVVEFLAERRRRLRGPFTVVWDGHGIHSRARPVRAWLAEHPEVTAVTLPPYSPALNPDERVWAWAKHGRLANLAVGDDVVLRDHVLDAPVEAKATPGLLASFVQGAELYLEK